VTASLSNLSRSGRVVGTALVLGSLLAPTAHAQPPANAEAEDAFELPPPRDSHPPHLAGEFHAELVFPFEDENICPRGAACIFGDGAGIGATLWWRYPRGFALGARYDVWFLDGNGVHELSSLQVLSFVLRQTFKLQHLMHPFLGVGIGGLLFGDTFQDNAVGGALDATAGLEIEITSQLAFTTALTARIFTTNAFNSRSDAVSRGEGFGLNAALALQFGLVLLPPP